MKRNRFSEEQIIGILKEHQAGLGTKELCRKHGVSDATFYQMAVEVWRHGGVRCPAAEGAGGRNAKLKKMLAEQMLDVATLKEMLGKNF